ncbi:MAG: T9SS type A sorting domain-containing protein, partial [Bacteroidales bacterium]|nr:T9SS type A sorting domain-containing protein [Bacteroidales bacterium]
KTQFTNGSVCTDNNGNKVGYYKDIDIGFSRDFTNISATGWHIDTSYTQNLPSGLHDFYAVAQHELGHAHSLDHVNDNTDLMYYTIPQGPISYANRRDLYSSANAIYGGVYVLDKSGLMTSCGSISIMLPATAENCESNIGVSELFNNDIIIQAYPNPIDAILNIKYSLKRNSDISFSIYDFMGRNINNVLNQKSYIGENSVEINFSDYPSGIYFLKINLGFKSETIKLIKL